jgi:hypothetical protein
VTGSPSLAAPTSVTVTVTYVTQPLAFLPTPSVTLSASSTETVQG